MNLKKMPVIKLHTNINAHIERCFDLARSIDLHKQSTPGTQEEAIAGVTSGLIGLNETVTWRAKHFGITQTLSSKITAFEYPFHFRDEMIQGVFKSIKHDHFFSEEPDGSTSMIDHFEFECPLGILGYLANELFLKKYLTVLLKKRNAIIKAEAEKIK